MIFKMSTTEIFFQMIFKCPHHDPMFLQFHAELNEQEFLKQEFNQLNPLYPHPSRDQIQGFNHLKKTASRSS